MKSIRTAIAIAIASLALVSMPAAVSQVPVAPAPTTSGKSCQLDMGRMVTVFKDGESFTHGRYTYTCENGIWRMKRTPAAAPATKLAPTSPAGTPSITSKSLEADGYKCTTVSVGFVECTKAGKTTYWCSSGVCTPKPRTGPGTEFRDRPVTSHQQLAPDPGGPIPIPLPNTPSAPAGSEPPSLDGEISTGRGRPTVVDHRESNTETPRRNEPVPARKGTLPAPSEVTISEVGRTSLRLNWMDNAAIEYGVAVERGTPVEDRGGINYQWKLAFNVEERVMTRVQGTGWRTDEDDQLEPGTNYCYRLRAYRKNQYSSYSRQACARTSP